MFSRTQKNAGILMLADQASAALSLGAKLPARPSNMDRVGAFFT
jgi:hypothetical protein